MTSPFIDVSLPGRLAFLRERTALSVSEVARRLDALGHPMNRMTYSRIEAGTREVTVSDAVALAEVFSVPLHVICASPELLPEHVSDPLVDLRDQMERTRELIDDLLNGVARAPAP